MQIKNYPEEYDVIVAGGGLAGTAAAVAAARKGCKVLLVEQYGFLGGMAVSAMVNPFMAYCCKYGEGEKFDWDKIANAGIFQTIIEDLQALGGLHSNRITFHEEFLKLVLDRLVRRYSIDVLFETFIIDVEQNDRMIRSILAANKGGVFRIKAGVFADATGDADLAALAGCPCEAGNEKGLAQPMTMCFRVMNVDTRIYAPLWGWYDGSYPGDSAACRDIVDAKFKEEKEKGNIKSPLEGVSTFACCLPGVIHFNSTRIQAAMPMDAETMSRAEMDAREQVHELFSFMKKNAPGFSESVLLASGPQIGVRESRRIKGDTVITERDILGCKKFPDSIARGTYCIDIHSVKEDDPAGRMTDIPYNDYYTIPYSALLPQGIKNLIVAGRPISSTHIAHGAHRVMPICTSVGEGAGAAAFLALDSGLDFRNVDINILQRDLEHYGSLY
jgi:hypothetical protein